MKNALHIAQSLHSFAVSNWGKNSHLAKDTEFLVDAIDRQHRAVSTLTSTLELLSSNRDLPVSQKKLELCGTSHQNGKEL